MKMRFAFMPPGGVYKPENLKLMKQIGCCDVIGQGPGGGAQPGVWEHGDLAQLKRVVEDHGLQLEVLEDGPRIEKIVYDLPGKEEQLEEFCKSLQNIGAAGIKVIKPQHMPPVRNMIWRTSLDKPTRGDATSTAFDYELVKDYPPTAKYGVYKEKDLWENLRYLLEGVLPTAEEAGVVVTFHPDDPPISPIQGFPRLLRSVEAFDRLMNLVPSDSVGINFCQGCFAEMGVDVPYAIRYFGRRNKIHFAHFRNIKGTVHSVGGFQEIFPDDPEGELDMVECMRAYYEVGFTGPMRPDHSPKVVGDNVFGGVEGYHMLGKIFSLGYMRGLAEGIEKEMEE